MNNQDEASKEQKYRPPNRRMRHGPRTANLFVQPVDRVTLPTQYKYQLLSVCARNTPSHTPVLRNRLPRNPCGLKIKITIRITNTTASCHCVGSFRTPNC